MAIQLKAVFGGGGDGGWGLTVKGLKSLMVKVMVKEFNG